MKYVSLASIKNTIYWCNLNLLNVELTCWYSPRNNAGFIGAILVDIHVSDLQLWYSYTFSAVRSAKNQLSTVDKNSIVTEKENFQKNIIPFLKTRKEDRTMTFITL